ncbi:MAG: sugar ABC transporter permease [Treponemataceae bacterium]|nr:sugar ABC transporter permease [Treponemataceae bacterium]
MFTVILLIPIIYAVYISLCDWNALGKPKFIGFTNYIKLFTKDAIFITALKNSIFFLVFSVVSQFIFGLLYAFILTNMSRRARNIYKNIIYLPCVLSSAALGLLFSFMLKPTMGLNQLLAMVGIKGPSWLIDTSWKIPLPMWVIGVVALWQYVGQSMMLYIAQISGINKSLYESSSIDGATKWQAFIRITMPLIKPMIATCVSLNCIGSLKFFDLVYNMTQGGPNHGTENIATWLYWQGFKFNKFGYASAMGIVLLVMCLLVTLITKKLIRSENYEM